MSPNTMRQLRRWHLYLGVFFAPAIFFFALSGALQTFRLQEDKGWGGAPPGWIVWMASVHKDSSLPRERAGHDDHDHADGKAAEPKPAAAPRPPQKHFTLPMKIFALLMSIGLMFSALTGAVIALYSRQTRRLAIAMLAAGVVLPIALLML
jgi:uncharacterized iron-regulated membrane protein